ncbi:hypothetical protein BUALT_Bualt18G0033200 [Buddleja alternifolia]|uniref:Serine/threonine-protein phosphatase 5 n=1 Tax=Buddleja alternifolia TaxID=168488 RepID=A0AAV6W390_9LAMI|nr:hypothetical protein BUALT_Bualt18G0033200 [Buddleja alternifolia]
MPPPGMATENSTRTSPAEELKTLANEAFKAHKYSQAIDLYTQAIEVDEHNAVYWANRAFAHTKLEEYGSAIQDATQAIEIDPRYSKGYYRRGAAHMAMGKFKEALKDFQQVKKLCPNDPDAAKKLKECEKAVMKQKFEEAISVPESKKCSVADSIDYHTIGSSPGSSFVPLKVTAVSAAVALVAVLAVYVGSRAAIAVAATAMAVVMVVWGIWSLQRQGFCQGRALDLEPDPSCSRFGRFGAPHGTKSRFGQCEITSVVFQKLNEVNTNVEWANTRIIGEVEEKNFEAFFGCPALYLRTLTIGFIGNIAGSKLRLAMELVELRHKASNLTMTCAFRILDVEPQYAGARIEGDIVTLDFVKKMMDDFKNQKCLHKRYAYQIVLQIRELLLALPSLVDITVPIGKHFTVCGDVHGQFYDLMNIFELNGLPSEDNPYLFNGDFVDRGSFSLEVILTLFAFKCMSPSAIYLSRGNHESKSMNKIYGFEGEVRSKLSDTFVELFAEVFCCLPLAHVINEKVLVVHGGLFSVDGVKLSDIRSIDRFCEPPEEGLMCELLWSDPQPQLGRGPSKRGVGLSFGADVTKRFLQDNNLDLVVRSHEVKDEGYEIEHDGKLITVFSAPNYCDQMGNKGAFIRFEAPELKPNIVTFSAVPHPDVKPMAYANNFLRMFS